jgi:hypothetical protein
MEKSLEKSCWKSKKICSNGWWENEKDRPKEPSFTIIYPCSANPWNFKYTWIWYDIYDQCLKAEYLCLPISSRDQSGVGRFLCYQSQDLEVLETALNERDAASASMDVLGGSTLASNSRIFHVYASRDQLISRKIITINIYIFHV